MWIFKVTTCILWCRRCFLTIIQFFQVDSSPTHTQLEVHMLFPNNDAIFHYDTPPEMFSYGFRSMKMHYNIFPGQHNRQTLNIIKPLWSVLDSRMRVRLPPQSSLKQLEYVLQEEWYSIPLETLHNLQVSIPRRIPTALQANGGPTPN